VVAVINSNTSALRDLSQTDYQNLRGARCRSRLDLYVMAKAIANF